MCLLLILTLFQVVLCVYITGKSTSLHRKIGCCGYNQAHLFQFYLWVRHVAADCLHHLCEMCTVGFILYWKHAGCVGWLKRSYKRWNVSCCYHKSRENLLGVRCATLWGGELVILLMSGQYATRVEFKCHINKRGFNLWNIKIMNNEIFFLWENRRKETDFRREGGRKQRKAVSLQIIWLLSDVCWSVKLSNPSLNFTALLTR